MRKTEKVICEHCQKEFECVSKKINYNKKNGFKIFCSHECYSKSKIKLSGLTCFNCKKPVIKGPSQVEKSKTGNVYCSKSCAASKNNSLFKKMTNHPNFIYGKGSYRRFKIENSDGKCEHCGIDTLCVLEVHHIDGNRKNNVLENLKLLCANCHKIEHCKIE